MEHRAKQMEHRISGPKRAGAIREPGRQRPNVQLGLGLAVMLAACVPLGRPIGRNAAYLSANTQVVQRSRLGPRARRKP
jgi:hypothetical protein